LPGKKEVDVNAAQGAAGQSPAGVPSPNPAAGTGTEINNNPAKEHVEPSGEDVGAIAWRSLFIVNELNELSTKMRKVTPETTLIWFIFLYLSLGWQWIGQTNPEFIETDQRLQPFNDFLKFFLSTFIYLCIVFVQVLIQMI